MPKLRTKRAAHKRFKVRGSGSIVRKRAFKSHNTAKKTPKRRRQLRGFVPVDKSNMRLVVGMLPNSR